MHPLNTSLCKQVTDSVPQAEAKEIVFQDKDRPGNKIKLLTYNTYFMPKWPAADDFPCCLQDERLADMAEHHF